jgi:hypothetical protein
MERVKRAALLTRLVERLRMSGSWCGETHVQKAVLFLQELVRVPLGFQFILYKHGPFSFELRDELTAMRADELLTLEPQQPPYGPRIAVTPRAARLQTLFSKTIANFESRIELVAEEIADKGVSELERLATAFYVIRHPNEGHGDPLHQILELKPHISSPDAAEAIAGWARPSSHIKRWCELWWSVCRRLFCSIDRLTEQR